MSTDKPRIGFVGLGLMGHGMARNLVAKGFPLTVRLHKNRKPAEDILAAGAKEVKTYAELARASDVVILCVTGSPQIEEIVYGENGILSAARDGLVVVDTSTAEPSSTAKIRDDLAKKGTKYVDAPLARTPKEAEEGRLNTMVGADDATFARLKPVLSAYSENVVHVGGPGHGHMVKLVNNFIAMSIATATAEPSSTAKIRDDLSKKGTRYVDAPLARTPKEAEEGRLNTMVGADDTTFARLKPVFSAYCENVIHVGGPGHGHMVKLVNNFIAMSIATATAEACAACAKSGVSIRKLHEIVSAGGVNSGIFQMMVGKMLESGDLTGLKFTLSNAMKDLRYYTHFVEALPSPAIIGEAVHQSMVNANLLGFGDKYVASLLEAQEKLGGVNIVRQ